MTFVGRLADFLWNPWLLGLFLLTGLVYSLGSGFFQLFGLRLWVQATFGSLFQPSAKTGGGLSSFQALATALASTMGTGS
ncbi:MAG: amino acid carrier protein, partial [Bacillota bacterium]